MKIVHVVNDVGAVVRSYVEEDGEAGTLEHHFERLCGDISGDILRGRSVLHMGCGETKIDGALNVDFVATAATDLVYDLSVTPWPTVWAPDEYYDHIEAVDIIEHFVDCWSVIREMYRVARHGATMHIRTTHCRTEQSFNDPQHHHFFTLGSFDYFDPGTWRGRKYAWYRAGMGVMKILEARPDGQELEFRLRKE